MSDCPYYERGNQRCAIRETYQDGYHKDNYCLSGSNWRNCPNYNGASYDEKVNKRERSNPDLWSGFDKKIICRVFYKQKMNPISVFRGGVSTIKTKKSIGGHYDW